MSRFRPVAVSLQQHPHRRVVQLCLPDVLLARQAGVARSDGTFDQRRQVLNPHAMHMGIAERFCPKRALNGGNQMIAIRVLVAIAALLAAGCWLRSALIKVPNNIDSIVGELQRIGHGNSLAAFASCAAARLAAVDLFYETFVQ